MPLTVLYPLTKYNKLSPSFVDAYKFVIATFNHGWKYRTVKNPYQRWEVEVRRVSYRTDTERKILDSMRKYGKMLIITRDLSFHPQSKWNTVRYVKTERELKDVNTKLKEELIWLGRGKRN